MKIFNAAYTEQVHTYLEIFPLLLGLYMHQVLSCVYHERDENDLYFWPKLFLKNHWNSVPPVAVTNVEITVLPSCCAPFLFSPFRSIRHLRKQGI